jgi:hypothetical protein
VIIVREISLTLSPQDKKQCGVSRHKWCLKQIVWNTSGMYWISLKYGLIRTILL